MQSSKQTLNEEFLIVLPTPGNDFTAEAADLLRRLRAVTAGHTVIMTRFYLSDVENQTPLLNKMLPPDGSFYSCIGQRPLDGTRIAAAVWLWRGKHPQSGDGASTVTTAGDLRLMLFRRELLDSENASSEEQMREEFTALAATVQQSGGTVSGNVQRTWIYCRDIDNNYAGLVKGRRELFTQYGLRADTHYIASTGIEGKSSRPHRLVRMDSLVIFGHDQRQIEHMSAPTHMSPTQLYNVTFERGTRIIFGDRSWYFISGTASIDANGAILHTGDVAAQTRRMLENIEVLLRNHQAELSDIQQATVYLRDAADRDQVRRELDKILPHDTPCLLLQAPVCRPGWLVEMECIAVNKNGDKKFTGLDI